MILVQLIEQIFVSQHGREDGHEEGRADARLALYVDRSTHLLDDSLANAQAEAGALLVQVLVRLELLEVDEQLVNIFHLNACSLISNLYLESH